MNKKGERQMQSQLHCESIKSDLKYLNKMIKEQVGREPTADIKRFQTQVLFRKELCKIEREK